MKTDIENRYDVVPEDKLKKTFKSSLYKIRKDPLKLEKADALRAAYDLFYDTKCIEEIETAKTIWDIDRALINARLRKFGDC